MSIRTNPMKAVPVLLKRVKTTRTILDQRGRREESLDGKLEKLTRELNKIDDLFMKVKKNQDELLDTLHEVDGHLRKLDRNRLDQDMDSICRRIRDGAHKLLPTEVFEEDDNTEIVQSPDDPSSSQNKKELLLYKEVDVTPYSLRYKLEYCLCTLSIFPEDAIINRRLIICCWIGAGMLTSKEEKTAEEEGEDVIDELMKLNLIVRYGNVMCPIVNKFKLSPHARPKLVQYVPREEHPHHLGYYLRLLQYYRWTWLVLTQQKVTLGDGNHLKFDSFIQIVFNVGVSYLNLGSQWLNKSKKLNVLQLGRWQNSPSHHIEVGNQDFLNNLSNQRQLRYLSLRGISRIFQLPPSITKVESLQILDLKAFHNLETLPDDISSLKNLTHLILSQCYMLDGMPNGIDRLTQLQVLKGFLLGTSNKTPCRISDLAKLKNRRRLSIHIRSEAVIKDGEFESLEELSKIQHLKISWGVFDKRYSEIQINLPLNLKKLHLEGFPGQKIPEWLKPSKVPRGLKELCLTGGKLKSMNHDEDTNEWGIEIMRLKYLKHSEVDLTNLRMLFPRLRYALIKPIPYQSNIEWNID